MAQPNPKIAEAFCGGDKGHEGDAKLRRYSIRSKSSLDPFARAKSEARAQPQHCGNAELAEESRPQARPVLPETVTPLAPELAAELLRMAPGTRGFNIEPRPQHSGQVGGPSAFEPPLGTRRLV